MPWLKHLFARRRRYDELSETIREHLDEKIADLMDRGMTREEAERTARREFGNVTRIEERSREVWQWPTLESIWTDVRFAIRQLWKSPGFTATAILTLALGIGVNVSLFSIINAVLLRSLPFRDPQRLVFIYESNLRVPKFGFSYPDYLDFRQQNQSFQETAVYSNSGRESSVLIHNGAAFQISGVAVSSNFFSLLGVSPEYGQDFSVETNQSGMDHVVLLSHHLWQQRFASDPSILGRSIELDGQTFTILGIMRQEVQFPKDADLWIPISQMSMDDLQNRRHRRVWGIGRLKEGINKKQALVDIATIANRLQNTYPADDKDVGILLTSLLDYFTGSVKTLLLILFQASILVMVIACANFANLLLGKAVRRNKEMAVRVALGATRKRILRQLLTESILLSAIGTAGGLFVAFLSIMLLNKWAVDFSSITRLNKTRIDLPVLLYSAGIALITGVLFGITPALQASKTDLVTSLKSAATTRHHRHPWSMRNLLVIGEIAVTVAVLVPTGLLVKTLGYLTKVDPGFRVHKVLTIQLALPPQKYSTYGATKSFYEELLQRVNAAPAIRDAATINILPIEPSLGLMHFGLAGQALRSLNEYPVAQIRSVSPNYFSVMGIALLRGRLFQDADLANGAKEGYVINEKLAKLYFQDQDPIGRKLLVVEASQPYAVPIIGVVSDVKDIGLDKNADPEIYAVGFQSKSALVIRTEIDNPDSLVPEILNIVKSIDPTQPIGDARTIMNIIDSSLSARRLLSALMASFSTLAFILSIIGLFGVISHSVRQQIPDIAVRMALGATRGNIARLVLRQGSQLVLYGGIGGLCASLVSTRLLSSLLVGVETFDLETTAFTIALLAAGTLVAILVPVWRAATLHPIQALRTE
ncbi:MAG: ABC transporter permease [Edaphobacter sp.]